MSKGWETGSTRAWRKLRAARLDLDQHTCQLAYPGRCLGRATTVHHLDGVKRGKIQPIDRLRSACAPCNQHAGDPTQTDPPPTPTRTQW